MPFVPPSGCCTAVRAVSSAAAVGLMLAACTTRTPLPSPPTVTVTATASTVVSSTPAAYRWNLEEPSISSGDAPDFPVDVDGWKTDFSWKTVTRAFVDSWSTSYGQDEPWPTSQDSCSGRFLVRWRSVDRGTPMRSRYGLPSFTTGDNEKPTIVEPSRAATGGAGWMVLNGCQVPQFRLRKGLGYDLSDVTVEVQHWQEAP